MLFGARSSLTGRREPSELALNYCSNVEGDSHERTTAHQTHGHTATCLANEAERIKTEAKELPQGKEREDMMRKARQAETASQISARLFSPGLQKPT